MSQGTNCLFIKLIHFLFLILSRPGLKKKFYSK